MRIQELEQLTGTDRATIRFYEKEGLLTPKRSENGYRDYSQKDAEELKKILLLRELGVTIDTIRRLQQGSEDFSEVMTRQAQILLNRAGRMEQASAVCRVLGSAGIDYAQLDTPKYQAMLNAPSELPSPAQEGIGGYTEKLEKEIHPWRRYFARMIDHSIIYALVIFFAVVILRWRPVSDGMRTLFQIGSWFVLVPAEASLLHFWGTTPGKWIMGIRIKHYEGGKLPLDAALHRAWKAVMSGVAFGIPVLADICMLWQYCKLTGRSWRRFQRYDDVQAPTDMEWDSESETFYTANLNKRQILSLIVIEAGCIALIAFSSMSSVLPIYRGNDLTVSQFAANYNQYHQILYSGNEVSMKKDGTFAEDDSYMTISIQGIESGPVPYDPVENFQYETEGERVTAITLHHSWYSHTIFWSGNESPEDSAVRWMMPYCDIAMIAVAAAQDGMTTEEIDEFREILAQKQELPASSGVNWTFENVTFSWKINANIESENEGTALYHITMDLRIEIQ